jgi:uncharacterized coiled-coil DUF342 family protein
MDEPIYNILENINNEIKEVIIIINNDIQNEQLNNVSNEVKEVSNEINEVSNDVKEVSNEVKEVSNEVNEVSNDVKEISNEINEVSNDVNEVSNEVNEVSNDVKEVSKDVNEVSNDVKEVSNDVKEVSNEVNEVSNEVKEVSNDVIIFSKDVNENSNKIINKINNNLDNKIMINSPNDESPKIECKKDDVFIDIPFKHTKEEITADFVNIQLNDNNSDKLETFEDKADKILAVIKENKKKINNNLYIISCKYDIIYYRYNSISLSLLIISTIITFIEAIRLTVVNYDTQFKGSEIGKYITQETISLIVNCVSLSLSTILTILSSIARFKNYKENMDKLKLIHDTLFNYKNLYDKEKNLIQYYKINNELNQEVFKKIQDTIEEYNKEIKNINIFENIRNTDIIKFNKIKVNHDLRLHQLASNREIELLKINTSMNKKKEEINSNKSITCYNFS